MQRNLDEAQNKSYEVERKLDRVLWEYIDALDKEQGRPQLIMTKLWQVDAEQGHEEPKRGQRP